MAAIQGVFKRYEKKYLLNPKQYHFLRTILTEYMEQDHYGLHTICNIYYDTDSFELIRNSIEKPVYKEKFRVRSYGIPQSGDMVFLELKKKYEGVVYKRRVPLLLPKANEYLLKNKESVEKSQILNEIGYFLNNIRPVPKVYIAYDRTALFGKEDEELRVTFDTNMRFRDYDLDLSKGDYGDSILEEDLYLMEIKMPGTMPLWLTHILADLEIFPTSFSKYGTCYKKTLIHKNNLIDESKLVTCKQKVNQPIGGITCA